jgi:hypothetical protein
MTPIAHLIVNELMPGLLCWRKLQTTGTVPAACREQAAGNGP